LRAHRLRQAQELLRVGVGLSGEAFVVAQADGSPIQPNSLTHEWVRVHPKVASERLGHSKVGITLDLYSHVLPGMQADAVAVVDAALVAVQKKRNSVG
jgi:hypothetical protein